MCIYYNVNKLFRFENKSGKSFLQTTDVLSLHIPSYHRQCSYFCIMVSFFYFFIFSTHSNILISLYHKCTTNIYFTVYRKLFCIFPCSFPCYFISFFIFIGDFFFLTVTVVRLETSRIFSLRKCSQRRNFRSILPSTGTQFCGSDDHWNCG